MILLTLMHKTFLQKIRDRANLFISLFTTPFFVVMIRLMYDGSVANDFHFQTMVHGLIVFSVIMVIFSTSMTLAKELSSQSIIRIRMSQNSVAVYGTAIAVMQLLEGAVTLVLTVLTAILCGYSPENIAIIGLYGILTTITMIGMGILIAAIAVNTSKAFLAASAVMFLFILFSGIIFPLPSITVGTISIFHYLPTTVLKNVIKSVTEGGFIWNELQDETVILCVSALLFLTAGITALYRYSKKEF